MPLSEEARLALDLAVRHMAEAAELDPAKTPRAAAHAAYYAMFHAARSVLMAEFGTASTKHGAVISAFGRFAEESSGEAAAHAVRLRRAYNTRLAGDYTGERISPEEAAEALSAASDFLAFCIRRSDALPSVDAP